MQKNDDNTQKTEKNKQETGNKQKNKKPQPQFNIYWIYGLIALAFLAIQLISMEPTAQKVSWQRFVDEMLTPHDVEKLVIVNKEKAEIYIKADKIDLSKYEDVAEKDFSADSNTPQYYFTIGSVEDVRNQLAIIQKDFNEDEIIRVEFENRRDVMGEVLGWLIPIALLIGVWLFIFRRMGGMGGSSGGIFSIGKSKAKIFENEDNKPKTNFKDVAGLVEAKVELNEIVDFLKTPEKYTNLGGKIPKGALLVGPPGTGKTLLAKAIAGEANVPFFSMSGSDFVEMFVGVGASRVRDLFNQAKEKAPCIIFIDEIDAIGRARGRNPNFNSNDERENTLNQLLTEMDGFNTNAGVIILAATNRADILDRALLRAGRFDRQIMVELPDLNEREEIFIVHMKPLKVSETIDIKFLAKQTPGFSGADIANICNESALIAARKEKKTIERQDFLDAIDRIVGGLEKKNKVISPKEKKTIAYHESGHATVSWLLEHAHPLVKVTIVPRGSALGAAWYLPNERQITTIEQITDEMCATLAGRAAEELHFGTVSTGALNDLEKVTRQAYAIISYYGMNSKIGNLSFYDSSGQQEYSFNRPYSEKTAEIIDKEAREMVEKQYNRAKEILRQNKASYLELATQLLEKEVIFTEDLEAIFGKQRSSETDEADKTDVVNEAEIVNDKT